MSQKRKLEEFHDPDYFNDIQKNVKYPKLSLSSTSLSLPKNVSPSKKNNYNNNITVKDRIEKIKNIIHKEFFKELELKEHEIIKIQDNILLTKKLLRRVRYAIVSNYYNRKSLNIELNAESTINTNDGTYLPFDNGISTFFGTAIGDKYRQSAIHPAIKNVINTKDTDYDNLLKIRPIREAAKTAKTTISEKLRTKKEEKKLQREAAATSSSPLSLLSSIIATGGGGGGTKRKNRIENNIVLDAEGNPVYYNDNKLSKDNMNCNLSTTDTNEIKSSNNNNNNNSNKPKKIEQLNTYRGQNQVKHLIVVGNTSKYVGDEKSTDGATHKWLIYVQTRTQTKIDKLLNKVRFFLHPSYRPNDIVDICNSPFQLVRRGWGEFPVRIQLFFREYLQQKPVQIVHNLVLDKTLSGLQTMGAETLVEIWLRSYDVTSSVPIAETTNTTQQELELIAKKSQSTTNENAFNDFIKKENEYNNEQFNEIQIKKEFVENSDDNDNSNTTTIRNEMIPENIFEFLNKIETQNPSDCHESEKIEPTIIDSPIIDNNNFKKQLTINNSNAIKNLNTIQLPLEESSSSMSSLQKYETKIPNQNINNQDKKSSIISLNYANDNNVKIKTEPKIDKEIIAHDSNSENNNNNNKNVTSTFTNTINVNNLPSKATIPSVFNNANVYQKKLVKCVDKDGNIKIVQMLVKQNPKQLSVVNLKNEQIQNLSMSNENKQNVNVSQPLLKTETIKMAAKHNTVSVTQVNEISSLPSDQISIKSDLKNASASITTILSTNYQNKNKLNTLNPQYIPPTIATKLNIKKIKSPLQNIRITNLHQQQQQQNQSLNNSSINLTNHQICFKEGKMFIVDPIQLKLKQQNKKQESLLKPQISLLKPTVKNDNFMNCIRNELKTDNLTKHTVIASDHDYTSLSGKSNIIKSSLPSSFVPLNANAGNNSTDKYQMLNYRNSLQNFVVKIEKYQDDNNLKLNYEKEFCNKFLNIEFINVRHAVEYLLRKLPIINELAEDINYKMEFPFIIPNENVVNEMILPKRRAIEWLHAKYISQLIKKHPKMNAMKLWTTKEIILFARKHAFTPVIIYSDNNSNDINIKNNSNNYNINDKNLNSIDNFKELIKNEIKKEKIKHQTVTSSNKISKWITNIMKIKNNLNINLNFDNNDNDDNDDEIIVDINDNENDEKIKNNKINEKYKNQLNMKNIIPIDEKYKNESYLIKDACNKNGICLEPEEIFPDVFQHSAHIILSASLRLFIEDLIRRAISEKEEINHINTDSLINVDDIKRIILSKTQFDFLTNKHLGISFNDQITENSEIR